MEETRFPLRNQRVHTFPPLDRKLRTQRTHLYFHLKKVSRFGQKRPYRKVQVGSFGLLYPWDFRVLRKSLTRKDLSDESDEHQLPIILRVVSVSLNKLRDCTTHQVGLVDLMFLTDGGHLIFEDFWKSYASLVFIFLHSIFSPYSIWNFGFASKFHSFWLGIQEG